jgi:hypothetical protein
MELHADVRAPSVPRFFIHHTLRVLRVHHLDMLEKPSMVAKKNAFCASFKSANRVLGFHAGRESARIDENRAQESHIGLGNVLTHAKPHGFRVRSDLPTNKDQRHDDASRT